MFLLRRWLSDSLASGLTSGLAAIAVIATAAVGRAETEDAVVKVFASTRFPNPAQPWVKLQPIQQSGTGVVVEGKWILTNAHVVAYGSDISVKGRQSNEKFEAKVLSLNYDVDLAVLTVDDEKFFDKRAPLPRAAGLPQVQDRVVVYGYPIGGTDLSITKGEVSRIEYAGYGRGIGPVVQISAPVNPGNSGGPAVVDNKMIGVVVSRLQNAQNIGHVVPNEEIDYYLKKLKDNQPHQKPGLAIPCFFQSLENKALRRKFAIDDAVRGVLIQISDADARGSLKSFDVVTKIGDFPLDNQGQVQLKNGLRAPFSYLISHLAKKDEVPVTIWRRGETRDIALPVTVQDRRLIRNYQGEALSYFVHGPLVFAPGRSDDLNLYAQMNRTFYLDNSPLVTRADDFVRFPGEELVVVSSRMFPHAVAKGYADPVGRTVKELNGVPIKNLRHLVESIRDCKDDHLTIRFADNFSELLVFDRKELERVTDEILEDNGIAVTRRGSPDMLKVWKAGR